MASFGRRPTAHAALAILLLGLGGCRKEGLPADQAKPRGDLRTLAVFYQQYAARHSGQPPKSLEEFEAYVREAADGQSEFLGGFDPKTGFVSTRDQQPWEWHFPKDNRTPAPPGGPQILIAEKTGVGGKRLVALTNLTVLELDEAGMKQYQTAP